jgi:hypothetical protein
VLAYLREGVVAVGLEDDVGMLRRLKREFGYFCLELVEEQEVCLAIGGELNDGKALASVERYDSASGRWCEVAPMSQGRYLVGACVVDGVVYVTGGRDTELHTLASVEQIVWPVMRGAREHPCHRPGNITARALLGAACMF